MLKRIRFRYRFDESGEEHEDEPGEEATNMRPVRDICLHTDPADMLQEVSKQPITQE